MKETWLLKTAHIHAQSAGWFFLCMLVVGGVVLWLEYRKEVKEEKQRNQKENK